MSKNEFSETIFLIRKSLEMTQATLSELSGVSIDMIRRIEKGNYAKKAVAKKLGLALELPSVIYRDRDNEIAVEHLCDHRLHWDRLYEKLLRVRFLSLEDRLKLEKVIDYFLLKL